VLLPPPNLGPPLLSRPCPSGETRLRNAVVQSLRREAQGATIPEFTSVLPPGSRRASTVSDTANAHFHDLDPQAVTEDALLKETTLTIIERMYAYEEPSVIDQDMTTLPHDRH
jgi:hypothetical protein